MLGVGPWSWAEGIIGLGNSYHTSLGGVAIGPAGAGGCLDFSSASGRRLQTLVADIVVRFIYFWVVD